MINAQYIAAQVIRSKRYAGIQWKNIPQCFLFPKSFDDRWGHDNRSRQEKGRAVERQTQQKSATRRTKQIGGRSDRIWGENGSGSLKIEDDSEDFRTRCYGAA